MSTLTVYIIAAVAFAGSWLVKRWLTTTYARWSRVPNTHGVTGAQTAAAILRANGVHNVRVELVRGRLTDHYDPQRDVLRLSAANYAGASVAAMAVSAHEAGHAMQDATGDFRLRLRRFLVPAAALGARFGPVVLIAGMLAGSGFVLRLGLILLAGTAVPDRHAARRVQRQPTGSEQPPPARPRRPGAGAGDQAGAGGCRLHLRGGGRHLDRLLRYALRRAPVERRGVRKVPARARRPWREWDERCRWPHRPTMGV